jgi:hypothetical protein
VSLYIFYQTSGGGRMKRAGSKRTYNSERDEVAGDGEGADLTLVASLVDETCRV